MEGNIRAAGGAAWGTGVWRPGSAGLPGAGSDSHAAMKVARALLLLLVLCAPARALIDDALDVIKLGREVAEEVITSWDVLGKPLNLTSGVELPLMHRRERVVLARLAGVTRAIARLEVGVGAAGAAALQLLTSRSRGVRLDLQLQLLADLLGSVAEGARKMREYVHLQQQLERATLEDFAWWCVAHDPGALPGLLERTHALLLPAHAAGSALLDSIAAQLQSEHPDLCELQLSPHQLIYDLYNSISLTEIKGYAMMQFSWMLLRIYGKGNFTQEASLTRQRYAERTLRTATNARGALAKASRDIYRCDPPVHKEGETYGEVTRLLQGYVENEVDMNSRGTCGENCPFYTVTQQYNCFDNLFCAKQRPCKGRILDCQFIESDMQICPASQSSNRRYEWIEYEGGRTFGQTSGYCRRGTTKVDSWWKWNLLHCSYCFCLCEDEAVDTEKFFSLKEAVAHHDTNKIVTGLRLVKLGRMFHLQVSEGTLLERGTVQPGGWVPVQSFDPADPGVAEGVDYHMLTYEKRAIDLDELDSPTGNILTGVRFRLLGAHLHFEIRSTPFNFTTGQLAPEKSRWISNDNTDGNNKGKPRKRLQLQMPDIPTRARYPLRVDSSHDQYIEFTNSDFDADAAQSTVPFIDIQPVQPLKGSTIASGAGVIHRGAKGSGGFIGLKLFTYDYSHHIQAEAPPSTFAEDRDNTEFTPTVN